MASTSDVLDNKWSLFIGRWCPFHDGHKYIVDAALACGKNVCIAVRDSGYDAIPTDVRVLAIQAVYKEQIECGYLQVIVIPDVSEVCVGRGVGYALMQAPEDVQVVSGTEVRRNLFEEDAPWPEEAKRVIDKWLQGQGYER